MQRYLKYSGYTLLTLLTIFNVSVGFNIIAGNIQPKRSPTSSSRTTASMSEAARLTEYYGEVASSACYSLNGVLVIEGEPWYFTIETARTFINPPNAPNKEYKNGFQMVKSNGSNIVPIQHRAANHIVYFNCIF